MLLNLINEPSDTRTHGVLKILAELVDDGFDEARFFQSAQRMVSALQQVALNESFVTSLRALAVSVFKGCFNMLEIIMEENKAVVKAFAEQTINEWMPFFIATLKAPLPPAPAEDVNTINSGSASLGKSTRYYSLWLANARAEQYKGLIKLKIQGENFQTSTFLCLVLMLLVQSFALLWR